MVEGLNLISIKSMTLNEKVRVIWNLGICTSDIRYIVHRLNWFVNGVSIVSWFVLEILKLQFEVLIWNDALDLLLIGLVGHWHMLVSFYLFKILLQLVLLRILMILLVISILATINTIIGHVLFIISIHRSGYYGWIILPTFHLMVAYVILNSLFWDFRFTKHFFAVKKHNAEWTSLIGESHHRCLVPYAPLGSCICHIWPLRILWLLRLGSIGHIGYIAHLALIFTCWSQLCFQILVFLSPLFQHVLSVLQLHASRWTLNVILRCGNALLALRGQFVDRLCTNGLLALNDAAKMRIIISTASINSHITLIILRYLFLTNIQMIHLVKSRRHIRRIINFLALLLCVLGININVCAAFPEAEVWSLIGCVATSIRILIVIPKKWTSLIVVCAYSNTLEWLLVQCKIDIHFICLKAIVIFKRLDFYLLLNIHNYTNIRFK